MDKQTRIKRQATIIKCLKSKLAATEQSECDAIKMMVAAMEELKKRDHTAKINIPNPINTLPSD